MEGVAYSTKSFDNIVDGSIFLLVLWRIAYLKVPVVTGNRDLIKVI